MPFVSPLFLFIFLPLFFAGYYLLPARLRNVFTCLASILFYAWGAPRFAPLLLATSCLDYALSLQMYRRPALRRPLLLCSLVLNVAVLFYFKYYNFFIAQLTAAGVPIDGSWRNAVLLPLGISFFTFHKLSYLIDVARGDVPPTDSLGDFLLYILLFPQLIAGPIVRFHELAPQIRHRVLTADGIGAGVRLFCVGLAKKVLIADYVTPFADAAFGHATAGSLAAPLTPAEAWVGIVAYAVQIFFDFSGYSDMARGLAEMMGFHFPLNFNQPYRATSITDFWRRWHMTLSAWMKSYLYIPLGGNRCGPGRSAVNLWTVFLLSGLWHGAQWTFVLWGAFHGLFLSLDKLFLLKLLDRAPRLARHATALVIVLLGWVLFRAEDVPTAVHYAAALIPSGSDWTAMDRFADCARRAWWMLAAGCVFSVWRSTQLLDSWLVALVLYALSVCSLVNASFSPFIYFRF